MSQPRKALTARSVVLSTLLGTRPPVLPVSVLVRAGELFGITEGTLRVALSRMAAAGEVEPDDGAYRLAGRLLDRQARQEASVAARTKAWRNRAWRFAFVAGGARSANDRSGLRQAMRSLRLAELREGVWVRPDNLAWTPPAVVAEQCRSALGRFDDDEPDPAELWDLAGWTRQADTLRKRLASHPPVDPADLAPGFVLSADILRHLQADPLLPPGLLPRGWPGDDLRTEYAAWDRAYRALLRTWLRS